LRKRAGDTALILGVLALYPLAALATVSPFAGIASSVRRPRCGCCRRACIEPETEAEERHGRDNRERGDRVQARHRANSDGVARS
jgi:hypothetical protein